MRYLLFIGLLSIVGCYKSDRPVEVQEDNYTTLKVYLSWCDAQNDPFCESTSPIFRGVVSIYPDENHAHSEDFLIISKETNIDGLAKINSLDAGSYYMILNTSFGLETRTIRLPARSVSLEEIIFF